MKGQLESLAGMTGIIEVFKFMAGIKDYIWIFVLLGSFGISAYEFLGHPTGNLVLFVLSRGTMYFITLWQPLQMLHFSTTQSLVAFMLSLGFAGELLLGLMNVLRLGAFFISAGSILSMIYSYYGVTLR
jgi:hypothetical protein